MPCYLICNPTAGDATARQFVDKHVLPLLTNVGLDYVNLSGSEEMAKEVLRISNDHEKVGEESDPITVDVIVAGGDGTIHEVVNAIFSANPTRFNRPINVTFAIIPCGTGVLTKILSPLHDLLRLIPSLANALYHSLFPESIVEPKPLAEVTDALKLLSLKAMVNRRALVEPLSVVKTTANNNAEPLYGVVVASTALHASILHDSESLRATIPDISRFKVAAQQNIDRWYEADVVFYPPENDTVAIYDQQKQTFLPFKGGLNEDAGSVTMTGPFAYFLSTVNVDRLESQFVISPLQRKLDNSKAMFVTVIRPLRDPSGSNDAELNVDRHSKFAAKLMSVLTAAYQAGKHIDLHYDADGLVKSEHGTSIGPAVVEYIRCGGWRWVSVSFLIRRSGSLAYPYPTEIQGGFVSLRRREDRQHRKRRSQDPFRVQLTLVCCYLMCERLAPRMSRNVVV